MSRFILVFVVVLLSIACEKDEPAIAQDGNEAPFAITVLAKQGATDFQIDLDKNGELRTPVNLFQKLELPESADELIIRDQLVSYHDWLRNDYSSHQIEINTDKVAVSRNYCFDESNFEVVGMANSEIYLTYVAASLEASGATSFSINVYNQDTEECQSQIIPTIAFPSNFTAKGNYFMLFQQDFQDNRELLLYDMRDLSLEKVALNADYNFSVIDDDNLYLFSRNGSYQILDLDTFNLVNAGSNQVFQNPITSGILDVRIEDGKMAFFVLNPQPSSIVSSPIIFDFTSNIVTGDGGALFKLIDELESQVQSPVSLKTFEINLKTEQIVVGYNYFKDTTSAVGGVAFIDFDGALLYNKEFDFIPNRIVLKPN